VIKGASRFKQVGLFKPNKNPWDTRFQSLKKKIVEILRNRPLSIDGILNLFKEEREQIFEQITIMEIEGKIKSISGGKIAI
jgi:predicted Rossmann fold nucleotide-binding protein DprA/Smf involved in DNA uptake